MGRPRKIVHRKRADITLNPATLAMAKQIGEETGEGLSGLIERLLDEHHRQLKQQGKR